MSRGVRCSNLGGAMPDLSALPDLIKWPCYGWVQVCQGTETGRGIPPRVVAECKLEARLYRSRAEFEAVTAPIIRVFREAWPDAYWPEAVIRPCGEVVVLGGSLYLGEADPALKPPPAPPDYSTAALIGGALGWMVRKVRRALRWWFL